MMVLLLFFSQLKKLKWRGFGEKGYWVLGISYWENQISYTSCNSCNRISSIEYRVLKLFSTHRT